MTNQDESKTAEVRIAQYLFLLRLKIRLKEENLLMEVYMEKS